MAVIIVLLYIIYKADLYIEIKEDSTIIWFTDFNGCRNFIVINK